MVFSLERIKLGNVLTNMNLGWPKETNVSTGLSSAGTRSWRWGGAGFCYYWGGVILFFMSFYSYLTEVFGKLCGRNLVVLVYIFSINGIWTCKWYIHMNWGWNWRICVLLRFNITNLELSYEARPELHSLIPSVTYLIMGAIFRPKYATRPGRASLNIRPLGELVDMYCTIPARLLSAMTRCMPCLV